MNAIFEPNAGQCFESNLASLIGRKTAIYKRKLHVSQRVRTRKQIESLKNKTDFLVANFSKLIVVHLADLDAIEFVLTGIRVSRQADVIHHGDFPGAAGPMMATYSPRLISSDTSRSA